MLNSFLNNKMYIWLAPSDGLYLDMIKFKGYNNRSDVEETLELGDKQKAQVDTFRTQVVIRAIRDSQLVYKRFSRWRESITKTEWDPMEYW